MEYKLIYSLAAVLVYSKVITMVITAPTIVEVESTPAASLEIEEWSTTFEPDETQSCNSSLEEHGDGTENSYMVTTGQPKLQVYDPWQYRPKQNEWNEPSGGFYQHAFGDNWKEYSDLLEKSLNTPVQTEPKWDSINEYNNWKKQQEEEEGGGGGGGTDWGWGAGGRRRIGGGWGTIGRGGRGRGRREEREKGGNGDPVENGTSASSGGKDSNGPSMHERNKPKEREGGSGFSHGSPRYGGVPDGFGQGFGGGDMVPYFGGGYGENSGTNMDDVRYMMDDIRNGGGSFGNFG